MATESIGPAGWTRPQVALLPGNRLHLQHGPIDLVIAATGENADVQRAYSAATERFHDVLAELVAELVILRQPLGTEFPIFRSPIAQSMAEACWPYRTAFITPMASVAGAVADAIKLAMLHEAPRLQTLHVNNGGDIAVHISEGSVLKIGLVSDLARAIPDGLITLDSTSGIGGIATSGWRGRSFSLGIADAVTVLAATAVKADAAATIIGNAVNVESDTIQRTAAHMLDPDSDLGKRPVTTQVGFLSEAQTRHALMAGQTKAKVVLAAEAASAVLIALNGQYAVLESSKGKRSDVSFSIGNAVQWYKNDL